MFALVSRVLYGVGAIAVVATLSASNVSATTLILDNAYGLPDQTYGHTPVALRFTALANVVLDSAVFVHAGLSDTLTLTKTGDPTVLASVAIPQIADPADPAEIGSFDYLWQIGIALQAGMTYDLTSGGTKQLSPAFLLSNAKHGYGDPNGDFNAHIDIVGGVFGGTFLPAESWAAFDHLMTSMAGMAVAEPSAAALLILALAGLGLAHQRRDHAAG